MIENHPKIHFKPSSPFPAYPRLQAGRRAGKGNIQNPSCGKSFPQDSQSPDTDLALLIQALLIPALQEIAIPAPGRSSFLPAAFPQGLGIFWDPWSLHSSLIAPNIPKYFAFLAIFQTGWVISEEIWNQKGWADGFQHLFVLTLPVPPQLLVDLFGNSPQLNPVLTAQILFLALRSQLLQQGIIKGASGQFWNPNHQIHPKSWEFHPTGAATDTEN